MEDGRVSNRLPSRSNRVRLESLDMDEGRVFKVLSQSFKTLRLESRDMDEGIIFNPFRCLHPRCWSYLLERSNSVRCWRVKSFFGSSGPHQWRDRLPVCLLASLAIDFSFAINSFL